MKLLNIIPSVDPAHGGTVEAVSQLTAALHARQHTVETVCLDADLESGFTHIHGAVHRLGPSVFKYAYNSRLSKWLRNNRDRFDAIIVHGVWQYPGLSAWSALRNSSVPYFVFPHGMLDPWFKQHYPLKHAKKWLYWNLVERRVLRDARAVLYTCDEERRRSADSFSPPAGTARVVALGIRDPQTEFAKNENTFYSRFPELKGKRIVLFMGRVHEKKGCDLLIKAFALACAGDARFHLMLAGPCEAREKAALDAAIAEAALGTRVTWAGLLRGELKYSALRESEVFALFSHQENFGFAMVEALALGTPVLVSDKVNTWREVVEDGAGYAAPDTLEGACMLMARWAELSESERIQFRERARACYLKRFEVGRSVESLVATLREEGVGAQ